jgi:arylsulfatase
MIRALAAIAMAALASTSLQAQSPAPAAPLFKTFPTAPRAPKGAPNILLIMTDDVGFGATSTFGGAIPMPAFDALATGGLRYNNFHTAALCSPTRAALLTGRNHHRVGFGALADMAVDEPGYNGVIPASAGTIGQVLKANGYDTAWFGKNHNTPPWENTPLGPFDRWPMGFGFDYFYGFNGAETDQFAPALVENLNDVRPNVGNRDYILDRDLADHAVQWLDLQKSVHADRPFLMYLAPGSAHDPNQAPDTWLARFRGKFDGGWDKLREDTFRRQKALGIIPAGAKMTPRPAAIPAWNTLTLQQKQVSARMMEAYAAQLTFFDEQVGRLIAELKRLGRYDNTLILYIQGDNGASEEYGIEGSNNAYAFLNGNAPNGAAMAKLVDEIGTRRSSMAIPAGWAYAMNTPFAYSKGVASHLGGLKDGMVVSWPAKLNGRGEVRRQFTHVTDIAPTIYEAAGVTPPAVIGTAKQMPLDGVSFAYSFTQPNAPERHREQYFEMLGDRSFYQDGWLASTTPVKEVWDHGPNHPDPKDFVWELYDLKSDYAQANNLAAKQPQRLNAMRAAFDAAAGVNNIYPLRADFFTRLSPTLRPATIVGNRNVATYYPGPTRYQANMFPALANSSWRATAQIEVPAGGGDGTLVAQGGWPMGWGLFVADGKPLFLYRQSDRDPEIRLTDAPLSPGRHNITGTFLSDGKPGGGGTVSLSVDGRPVGTAQVAKRWTFINLPATVGMLGDQPISDDQTLPFVYKGRLDHVTIESGLNEVRPNG